MSMVSIIEGPWRSKSPFVGHDGQPRRLPVGRRRRRRTAKTISSLGKFDVDLQARAGASGKKAEKDRTGHRPLLHRQLESRRPTPGSRSPAATCGSAARTRPAARSRPRSPRRWAAASCAPTSCKAAKDWLDDLRVKVARPCDVRATSCCTRGSRQSGPTIKSGGRTIKLSAPSTGHHRRRGVHEQEGDGADGEPARQPAGLGRTRWCGARSRPRTPTPRRPSWSTSSSPRRTPPTTRRPRRRPTRGGRGRGCTAGQEAEGRPRRKAKAKAKGEITAANAADPAAYKALQELGVARQDGAASRRPSWSSASTRSRSRCTGSRTRPRRPRRGPSGWSPPR